MAVVLTALGVMISSAFALHDQTVGTMILHEVTELKRHEEGLDQTQAEELGNRQLETLFFTRAVMSLSQEGGKTEGTLKMEERQVEIQLGRFCPEEFLRQMTLTEQLRE